MRTCPLFGPPTVHSRRSEQYSAPARALHRGQDRSLRTPTCRQLLRFAHQIPDPHWHLQGSNAPVSLSALLDAPQRPHHDLHPRSLAIAPVSALRIHPATQPWRSLMHICGQWHQRACVTASPRSGEILSLPDMLQHSSMTSSHPPARCAASTALSLAAASHLCTPTARQPQAASRAFVPERPRPGIISRLRADPDRRRVLSSMSPPQGAHRAGGLGARITVDAHAATSTPISACACPTAVPQIRLLNVHPYIIRIAVRLAEQR